MAAKEIAIIRADIAKLGDAEKITKGLVASLAIDCLDFIHEHGQSAVMNELALVLSPANKKAVLAFFKKFSGFQWNKEEESFTKKMKPVHDKDGLVTKDPYTDAKLAFTEFKESGNSFWTWFNAQNKVDKNTEASPIDLAKLTKTVKAAAEKAQKQGVSKVAVFNAVVSDVFTAQEILQLLAVATTVAPGVKANDHLAGAKAE